MRIFSGVRPTGPLHIGNYAGALSQWLAIQKDPKNEGYFCIVDLHALIDNPPAKTLTHDIMETAASYLAFGLNDSKFHAFIQSHVPAHSELAWILGTQAGLGELERMTQFKDKAGYSEILKVRDLVLEKIHNAMEHFETLRFKSEGAHHQAVREDHAEMKEHYGVLKEVLEDFSSILSSRNKEIKAGLLNYPVLMAADILLYDADRVPVGEDQVQHIELAKDLARRFNNKYGETFVVPEPLVQKTGARVMSLQDPQRKMSKSLGPAHFLGIFEPEEVVRKKIMSAVTDSGSEIKFDAKAKPAVSNLLTILTLLSDKPLTEIEAEMQGVSYAGFKQKIADSFFEKFGQVRERKAELDNDPHHTLFELKHGAEKAREYAETKIRDVKFKVGLL